jgi:TonB family protein
MPDAARVAQAIPLEVPIVLRGAKTSSETGKPELFTETARTILVFDNGVVLNIHSRLTVGQTVFIHNTQNGREVLCKVLEAPPENEPGFTDLEFTTAQEDFWGANAGNATAADEAQAQGAAPAPSTANAESDERAKMREPSGRPADDPLAMMLENSAQIDVPSMTNPSKESGMPLKEELMSAHEMAPDPNAAPISVPDFEPAVTSDKPSSEPTGEQIDAALKQMTSAGAPLPGTEDEGSSDEKHIAALMARDARLAKFAAFKERQQAEKSQGPAKAADTAPAPAAAPATKRSAERKSEAAESNDQEVKTIASKPSVGDLLTSAKYSKYVLTGAIALIGVALFFVWRAMHVPTVQDNFQIASATPANPAPAAQPPAGSAMPADSDSASAAQPAASPVKSSRSEAAEARPPRNRAGEATDTDAEAARRHRFTDVHGDPITPAQVISQPQPTLPPWAVGVGVDGVVTLDAELDERGNVTGMKVLSGPRQLQREAERAIGLWEFAPARADGKPVASHLTLSVQFLPPPPPKRVY